ncbi:MAG: DUF1178 family protein [Betaproteobacteria bacterium]|nr:MAG: DUF1178 family protein [Betaproteobacteria bacterium]
MIVFDLICRDQHRFEGWFSSGDDFSSQQTRGLLECPVCGGAHVEKLLTAKIRKQPEPATPKPENTPQTGVAKPFDAANMIDYILTHSEDVGKSFAEEARRIYYEQAPQRSIRGVATRSEAEDLHDEGVPVFSLPVPAKDRWN